MTDLGTDISTPTGPDGIVDLDTTDRTVTGRAALVQALVRRLSTPRGELANIGDDADGTYGLDVRSYLGEDIGPRQEYAIAAEVQAECLRDERVRSARVAASLVADGLTLGVRLADAAGPFSLVLAVSAVSVAVLKVQ